MGEAVNKEIGWERLSTLYEMRHICVCYYIELTASANGLQGIHAKTSDKPITQRTISDIGPDIGTTVNVHWIGTMRVL